MLRTRFGCTCLSGLPPFLVPVVMRCFRQRLLPRRCAAQHERLVPACCPVRRRLNSAGVLANVGPIMVGYEGPLGVRLGRLGQQAGQ